MITKNNDKMASQDRIDFDIDFYLISVARKLCPQWMNPIHNAHYLDVRRELIHAYELGRENKKTKDIHAKE